MLNRIREKLLDGSSDVNEAVINQCNFCSLEEADAIEWNGYLACLHCGYPYEIKKPGVSYTEFVNETTYRNYMENNKSVVHDTQDAIDQLEKFLQWYRTNSQKGHQHRHY